MSVEEDARINWEEINLLRDEVAKLRHALKQLNKQRASALDQPAPESNKCKHCDGKGWCLGPDWNTGEASQIQCRACLGTGETESNKCAECARKDVAIRELLRVFEKEAGNTVFISNADEARVMEAVVAAQNSKLR